MVGDRIGALGPAGGPAVHGRRQGGAQRGHGGGPGSSDSPAEAHPGQKLDIVEVGDRRVSDAVVTTERYFGGQAPMVHRTLTDAIGSDRSIEELVTAGPCQRTPNTTKPPPEQGFRHDSVGALGSV